MPDLPVDSTWYFYRGRVAMYALLRALIFSPAMKYWFRDLRASRYPARFWGCAQNRYMSTLTRKRTTWIPIDWRARSPAAPESLLLSIVLGFPATWIGLCTLHARTGSP